MTKAETRLKNALYILTQDLVHGYLRCNMYEHASGYDKAMTHIALCTVFVAVWKGVSQERVRFLHEDEYQAVHDDTQELTGYMDKVIGFDPEDKEPDYHGLGLKFFENFYKLATKTLNKMERNKS